MAIAYNMPCFHPLKGWYSRQKTANNKRQIVFNLKDGYADMPVQVPCGQCIGCRLDHSRSWAFRCVAELQEHNTSCFLTLTYDDENLPIDAGLDYQHFQHFLKMFRKKIYPQKIRFFMCGEYGENHFDKKRKHLEQYGVSALGRPHYHAIIFGYDFADKQFFKKTPNGNDLYTSELLNSLWKYGKNNTIGQVTFESAGYVARYCTKKINGEKADEHYTRMNSRTGEIIKIKPEFTNMSRGGNTKSTENKGGIGAKYYDQFRGDLYNKEFVTFKGKKIKCPRFYDKKLEQDDEKLMEEIKAKRLKLAKALNADNSYYRMASKEKVKKAQAGMLTRNLID